jgi:DNA-binding FadR family transcriptional regulator
MSLCALDASVAEVISLSLSVQTLTYDQLFEVRHALELRSAAAAAEHRTDEDLVRLRAALPDPAALPREEDDILSLDLAFHRALADCGHNPLIVGFAGATATAFRRFSDDVQGVDRDRTLAHLDEIVAAVEAGDGAAAQDAMARHLDYFVRYFALR